MNHEHTHTHTHQACSAREHCATEMAGTRTLVSLETVHEQLLEGADSAGPFVAHVVTAQSTVIDVKPVVPSTAAQAPTSTRTPPTPAQSLSQNEVTLGQYWEDRENSNQWAGWSNRAVRDFCTFQCSQALLSVCAWSGGGGRVHVFTWCGVGESELAVPIAHCPLSLPHLASQH
jgi:hypothetical protein